MGERLVRPLVAQHRRHVARNLCQRLDEFSLERRPDKPARLAGGDGEAGEHRQLAGQGLGRGHADLGTGERRQDAIGLPRDGRLAHIDDRDDVLALGAAVAQRRQRVRRLARLRDEQGGAAFIERRLAVAEFRGDIDVDGEPRPALEPVFGNQAGIEGGAAGREREAAKVGKVERKRRHVDAVRGKIDIGGKRMADHFWLLVDLLGHEVAVVALVDDESGRVGAGDRPLDRLAATVADGDAFARQHRPVAVLEIGDRVGEGGERDGI